MSIVFEGLGGGADVAATMDGRLGGLTGLMLAVDLSASEAAMVGDLRIAMRGEGDEDQQAPVITTPTTANGVLGMSAEFVASVDIACTLDAILPIGGTAYGLDSEAGPGDTPAFMAGQVELRCSMLEVYEAEAFAFVVPEGPVVAIHAGVVYEQAIESVGGGADFDNLPIMGLWERAGASINGQPALQTYQSLADGVAAADALFLIVRELIEEGFDVEGPAAANYWAIARVADGMTLAGVVGGWLDALLVITEAIAAKAASDAVLRMSITEDAGLQAITANALRAAQRLVADIMTAADAGAAAVIGAVLNDGVAAAIESGGFAVLVSQLAEGVDFAMHLQLDGAAYVAHAVNTATRGHTTYENYPFNSFATIGGRQYGMTDDGIRLLEGETDAGAPINGRVRLAMTNMGLTNLKRIRYGYLGMTATGAMRLKVITVDPDSRERQAHVYRVVEGPAGDGSPVQARVQVGEGLRSVYWGFELEAIDGARFELDTIKIVPVVLGMRMDGRNGGER